MSIKKSTVFRWVAIAATALTLAACSTTGEKAPIDNGDDGLGGPGTKVSGLGDNSGFMGSDSSFGGAGGGLHGSNMQVGDQTYYFDFNKDDVHDADKPSIQVQANYLIKHPNGKILLEGYTDPRGSREYNVALGERRAKAVMQVMQSDGVNANQLQEVSYGAEKLASPDHTEAGYALDRRVHLVYIEK